jgi:hypothetical protein
MVVALTPDAPRTTRERLLEVADYVDKSNGEHRRTLVIFRDPRQPVPTRKLGRSEQYGHAFAVAMIDSDAHIREVRTGVFN